jgi:hypothetical protein
VSGGEQPIRGARDHVDQRGAALGRGRDVEEADLVGALGVVGRGLLDRIASVAQLHEVDALDHAAIGHVETRNDAAAQHGAPPATATASATVKWRS